MVTRTLCRSVAAPCPTSDNGVSVALGVVSRALASAKPTKPVQPRREAVIYRARPGCHTGPSGAPGPESWLDFPGMSRSILPQTVQRQPVLPLGNGSTVYQRWALHSIQPCLGRSGGSMLSITLLFLRYPDRCRSVGIA